MKIKHIIFFLSISLFFSCETDDSTTILITESDLTGTWNLVEQRIEDGTISYSGNGQSITANYSVYAKNIAMTMTFDASPKKVITEGKYTLVATATILGQTNTEEILSRKVLFQDNLSNAF